MPVAAPRHTHRTVQPSCLLQATVNTQGTRNPEARETGAIDFWERACNQKGLCAHKENSCVLL
eukprot:2091211-Amphidinium_carterae.4